MAVVVAVGIVYDQHGQVLLALRPSHCYLGGLWEFPGGKVEPGESVEAALCRELYEEIGIVAEHYRPLAQIEHRYPDRQVALNVWQIQRYSGVPTGKEGQELRWAAIAQLPEYNFVAANHRIIALLNQAPIECNKLG